MFVSGKEENTDANGALRATSPGLAAQTPLRSVKGHGPYVLVLR